MGYDNIVIIRLLIYKFFPESGGEKDNEISRKWKLNATCQVWNPQNMWREEWCKMMYKTSCKWRGPWKLSLAGCFKRKTLIKCTKMISTHLQILFSGLSLSVSSRLPRLPLSSTIENQHKKDFLVQEPLIIVLKI